MGRRKAAAAPECLCTLADPWSYLPDAQTDCIPPLPPGVPLAPLTLAREVHHPHGLQLVLVGFKFISFCQIFTSSSDCLTDGLQWILQAPSVRHEGSKLTAYWVLVVNLSLVKLLEEVCVCLHIPKYFRRVMVCVLRIRGPLCSQQMMLGKPQPLLQGSLTGPSIASMAPTGFALPPFSLLC